LRRARLHRPGALAGARNAELNEKLQRTVAKRQAWQGVAKSREAVVAGLCATLDNLMQTQSPCAGAGAAGAGPRACSQCCYELEQEARNRARAPGRRRPAAGEQEMQGGGKEGGYLEVAAALVLVVGAVVPPCHW
jgi:hypothetical protein